MSTISKLLGVQDVRSALLAAECCALLGDVKMKARRLDSAKRWLTRAIDIHSDLGPPSSLCGSLRSLALILCAEERYPEARHVLQRVESLHSQYETDACVKALAQAELAAVEIALGQQDSARERLCAVVRALRKRKRDDEPHTLEALHTAASALSDIVAPKARLRRTTAPEMVEHRGPPATD